MDNREMLRGMVKVLHDAGYTNMQIAEAFHVSESIVRSVSRP